MSRPPLLAWVLLGALGVVWGSSFMMTSIAVRELPPLMIVALRLSLAAAFVWVYARAVGARLPRMKDPAGARVFRFAFAAAIVGNILPFSLISWGQQYIPSALSGLLMAPMPLMSLMLSHFLVAGEGLTAARLFGFLIGFSGVVLLIGTEALGQLGRGDMMALAAQLATLMAALGYAMSSIILKRAAAPDALGISVAILGIGAAFTLPLAMISAGGTLLVAEWQTLAAVLALGLGSTALAQVVLMKILALTGPPFLSTVNYQVPLWAVIFGVAFLGETLSASFWPALGLILSGLAVAQFAGRRGG